MADGAWTAGCGGTAMLTFHTAFLIDGGFFCNLVRAIAGVCAWASIIITTFQIYKHLKHYNNPRHQKCT